MNRKRARFDDDLLAIPAFLRRAVNVRGRTKGARHAAPVPLIAPPPGRAWAEATEWQIHAKNDDLGLPTGQRKALVIVGRKHVRLWIGGEYGKITRAAWDSLKKRPWVEVANVVIICLTAFTESLWWKWAADPVVYIGWIVYLIGA